MPRPLRFLAGILLLDYTLWWWHRWNHVAPPLWRFHVVHHLDRELDASTALRFHFGELMEQTNSNWSSLFSWWDMLHGTFIYDVPQDSITIGVEGFGEDLGLPKLLALPFERGERASCPHSPSVSLGEDQ